MLLPMSRPASIIGFILLLAVLPAHAFQADARPSSQGLPAGGGLDPQRVTDLRYGGATTASGPASDAARQSLAPASTPASAPPERTQIAGALATLSLERTADTGSENQVPLTFGQAFGPGKLARETQLIAKLADGKQVALQVDAKAFHDDGSVRHAVISGILPAPGAKRIVFGLARRDPGSRNEAGAPTAVEASPTALARSGLTASVGLTMGDKRYEASLERLLAQGKPASWLAGPVVHEWLVSAPLADRNGSEHPHLAARFAVRWYPSLKKARVDVTIENNWAYEPEPQNFTYDVQVDVGGKTVYRKDQLTHYHHARWRKLAWWGGGDPALHLRHDSRQLIDSYALPNYDRTVGISESSLSKTFSAWSGSKTEPMGIGLAMAAMPTTGGRGDIGLQPAWAVDYLLSMDPRAKTVTMGTADLAGSWSMHYRDRRTGLPVSLLDYPYMTIVGRPTDTRNPATKKFEAFPTCVSREDCRTPNRHDIPHQPNFAYLPYLLTGDHYHLEELQFWAMFDVFASNPNYRENRKGLVKPEQVRGQAWALRTLAEAAYITPEQHPLKQHFLQILNSNLDWYNAEYTNNGRANALGFIANGYSVLYLEKTAIAPWQDDFFTSAVGRAAELGFKKAAPLLRWKAKFPVSRMIGKDSCWITGAMYAMRVRDTPTSPFYETIGEAFAKTPRPELEGLACASDAMASALKLRPGEMTGYSSAVSGFPSNMQPALAYAADVAGEPGKKAWKVFMARSVKPDYGDGAQFAIVPRDQ